LISHSYILLITVQKPPSHQYSAPESGFCTKETDSLNLFCSQGRPLASSQVATPAWSRSSNTKQTILQHEQSQHIYFVKSGSLVEMKKRPPVGISSLQKQSSQREMPPVDIIMGPANSQGYIWSCVWMRPGSGGHVRIRAYPSDRINRSIMAPRKQCGNEESTSWCGKPWRADLGLRLSCGIVTTELRGRPPK